MRKTKEGVSIITCTNKTKFMKNIFTNYRNQALKNKELIVILNNDKLRLNKWRAKARNFQHVSVYQIPEKVSLGSCLNFAVKKAKYNYIAKFDDDDFYAPAYLPNSLLALKISKADIVGKKTHFLYMPDSQLLVIRNPFAENRLVRRVEGGTILAKRSVFNRVKFRDVSLGEDNRFYEDCRAKGFKIFATNRFFYTYMRRNNNRDHTWRTDKKFLLRNSIKVAKTKNYRFYVNPRNAASGAKKLTRFYRKL